MLDTGSWLILLRYWGIINGTSPQVSLKQSMRLFFGCTSMFWNSMAFWCDLSQDKLMVGGLPSLWTCWASCRTRTSCASRVLFKRQVVMIWIWYNIDFKVDPHLFIYIETWYLCTDMLQLSTSLDFIFGIKWNYNISTNNQSFSKGSSCTTKICMYGFTKLIGCRF